MIHQVIYAGLPSKVQVPINPNQGQQGFLKGPTKPLYPWDVLRSILETTDDTLVWIITKAQLESGYMQAIKDHGLEKYLVVQQDGPKEGTRNRNYAGDPYRLRVFIMKGKGKKNG